MTKNFFRISAIILVNLFAFLLFGIILGALFGNQGKILIGAVIVSIVPLIIFLFLEIKKVNQEFNNISKEKQDDGNSK